MSTESAKQSSKGGRRGGRQFPQIGLKDAIDYAGKLVSKTHTGPQPESIILTGVFGSGTSSGKIRAAAIKQFGLMEGIASAYKASELAKLIIAAPNDERQNFYQTAALKPPLFRSLYETFKGDLVSSAKIRQQASNLDVHPENLAKCVSIFMESFHFSGLGKQNGDEIRFLSHAESVITQSEDIVDDVEKLEIETDKKNETDKSSISQNSKAPIPDRLHDLPASGRSVIHINIEVSASLDTEKLERHLELLRRYGAI